MLGDIHSFNPDFSIILGNFNARSNKWWVGDNQISEGSQIDSLTTSYGFKQLMSEPTYILKNSSSCIGLISTDRPSLVIDSSTHPSLRPNFHHKIIHCKIDLKIIYPRSYMRLIWDFKRANISSIRKAIKMIDWRCMFLNKNVPKQVSIFDKALMNIFTNYIPNRYITTDDRDSPWMNEIIKNKVKLKKSLHKSNNFIEIQKLLAADMILKRKEKYYHHLSLKLNNLNTSAKTYWSILKPFYNDTQVPLIPSLLVNNKIVSDFTKKANLFNDFFATQCTPLTNSSVLSSTISFKTRSRLNTISFGKEDILKIITNLNVNKAYGHDDISLRMLEICDSEVAEPLSFIYKIA